MAKNEHGRGDRKWELDLIEKSKAGGVEAKSELLLTHKLLLAKLAKRYRFALDYEDALQEITLGFLELIEKADGRARLATMAYCMLPLRMSLGSKAAQLIRMPQSPRGDAASPGRATVATGHGDEDSGTAPWLNAPDASLGENSVVEAAIHTEQLDSVKNLMKYLTPGQRDIITRKYLGDSGGNLDEMTEAEKTSEKRALARLRELAAESQG